MFWKQSEGFKDSFQIESEDTVQTNNNGQLQQVYAQSGLSLIRKVGNSGHSRTARTQANINMVRRALKVNPLLN